MTIIFTTNEFFNILLSQCDIIDHLSNHCDVIGLLFKDLTILVRVLHRWPQSPSFGFQVWSTDSSTSRQHLFPPGVKLRCQQTKWVLLFRSSHFLTSFTTYVKFFVLGMIYWTLNRILDCVKARMCIKLWLCPPLFMITDNCIICYLLKSDIQIPMYPSGTRKLMLDKSDS